jgi:predicted ATPase/serine/threonine protein kinase
MNPERHARIGDLFHAALEQPPAERSAFLERACGDDVELRQEVESLLAAHDRAGDFVATPAMKIVAELMAQEGGSLTGRIGAYDVLSLIGRGGMGEVYLARDMRLGRNVAVKLLQAPMTSNPDAVRRFEQEARAASSLNHPNIVTIHEIGDLHDRRYIAMEFVDGKSLAAMIGRPLDVDTLARLGVQLARALSVAHAAGIVHRDIKPENVIVRADGYLKVLDFGLARLAPPPALNTAQSTPTSPSVILGTPRYMSPEQARGEAATSASDIFSFGVVLYELATGHHPFESETLLGTLHAIASGAAQSPLHWVPSMPASLERLLMRMLDKSDVARPPAEEVEATLVQLGAGMLHPTPIPAPAAPAAEPRRHTLPSQRTALVGRKAELVTVKGMLLDPGVRLLTLTGPGGTGKTRLAIQIAEDLQPLFEGGVTFVNLAPLADSAHVASAVAQSLGVRESGERPLVDAVVEHLRGLGPALLLLDNFEQVADAASLVKELLDACPALTVLVTSRVVLRIYGEQEFPVPPLSLPEADAYTSPASLMQFAAIALFVQRASAGRPDFVLTPRNASAVVEICQRLDGLPLAIELAAARVKVLPPSELLMRIERPLELLTGGARDLPERQQTLREAIKWSYDLLTVPEQTLFRRLSVFRGGCTLEAAEAVSNHAEDLGVDVLDGVGSLVDNSLLVQRVSDDREPRFVMLETFREYGRERLAWHGESAATHRAHAAYMLVLAEEETFDMSPAEREAWLRGCDAEHDNLRGALHFLIDSGDAEWALRLASALFRFWEQRDHLSEGRKAFTKVLAMPNAAAPTRLRARALYCAAVLADIQGESDAARALSRESCRIYQEFGDTQGVATSMTVMAYQAQRQGRYEEATSLFGETVALWEQLGEVTAVDLATSNMAHAAKTGGDAALAQRLLEQVAASSQARGDVRGFAFALNGLGDVAASRGDRESARRYHYESLARYREIADQWGIARVLSDLGALHLDAEEFDEADVVLRDAIAAFRTLGHQRGVARQLESLAWCAISRSRDRAAVTLAGAAAAIRQRISAPAKPAERQTFERRLSQARERLGDVEYTRAWHAGTTASVDDVLALETRDLAR